jgi:hypothetical protein
MYLREDGSLDWVVSEQNVYSDEADQTERAAEESCYVEAIARDEHPLATSFRGLGGTNVRTRVLRDTRPYHVMVDAQFSSLSDLVDRALTGVPHHVELTTDDGVTTWRLWADVLEGGESSGSEGESDDCATGGLSDALDALSIRLVSGRFTNAVGFTIESADRVSIDKASLDDHEKKDPGHMGLSLSWTSRPPAS